MTKLNLLVLCGLVLLIESCSAPTPKALETPNQKPTTEELMAIADHPGNPIITDKYTADPATLVYNDTVYLYCGHDEAKPQDPFYVINEWLIYKSTNLKTWEECPVSFKVSDFEWNVGPHAWASQVIEKNGKFYWYITARYKEGGFAVGVAVGDSPTGPFKDAIGKPLISNDMTTNVSIDWDDIDPTVFTDVDGQTYLFWGNTSCKWAKLKDNMTELDGEIHYLELPHYVEAPWVHKKGDWYYLTYSYNFPEKTAYAMSKSITGPWEFKGIINEVAGNCNTNHQAILEFKGKDYFVYHNGSLPTDGHDFRRSICIDYLYYNPDGTIKKIQMTSEGVAPVE